MDYVDYAVILLAIVLICLLAADGARAVQDSRISHEPPSTGVVEEVILTDCDKVYITIGDAIYHLDCDDYIPAEGAEVSYHANGERIFDIAPTDDEE